MRPPTRFEVYPGLANKPSRPTEEPFSIDHPFGPTALGPFFFPVPSFLSTPVSGKLVAQVFTLSPKSHAAPSVLPLRRCFPHRFVSIPREVEVPRLGVEDAILSFQPWLPFPYVIRGQPTYCSSTATLATVATATPPSSLSASASKFFLRFLSFGLAAPFLLGK